MTADDLLKALYGVCIAALTLVTLGLGVVTRYMPEMIRTFLENKRLISMQTAGTLAAQSVEERARAEKLSSSEKAAAAAAIVKSIAPVALAKGPAQVADVVQAGVAQMRQSLPNPELSPDIRIIPPPPRVPSEGA